MGVIIGWKFLSPFLADTLYLHRNVLPVFLSAVTSLTRISPPPPHGLCLTRTSPPPPTHPTVFVSQGLHPTPHPHTVFVSQGLHPPPSHGLCLTILPGLCLTRTSPPSHPIFVSQGPPSPPPQSVSQDSPPPPPGLPIVCLT